MSLNASGKKERKKESERGRKIDVNYIDADPNAKASHSLGISKVSRNIYLQQL